MAAHWRRAQAATTSSPSQVGAGTRVHVAQAVNLQCPPTSIVSGAYGEPSSDEESLSQMKTRPARRSEKHGEAGNVEVVCLAFPGFRWQIVGENGY